jgi:hypothetical protein
VSVTLADHLNRPIRGHGHGQAHDPEIASAPAGVEHPRGGSRHGHDQLERDDASAAPARFAARVDFLKEEVFEICGALALGEALLTRLGLAREAAHLATVFAVVESRLVVPQASAASAPALSPCS